MQVEHFLYNGSLNAELRLADLAWWMVMASYCGKESLRSPRCAQEYREYQSKYGANGQQVREIYELVRREGRAGYLWPKFPYDNLFAVLLCAGARAVKHDVFWDLEELKITPKLLGLAEIERDIQPSLVVWRNGVNSQGVCQASVPDIPHLQVLRIK